MPNKFVQDLSGPKAGAYTAQDYIGPEAGQSDLLKSIGELGGAVSNLRGEQILRTAQSEMSLATGAAGSYQQAEELYLRQRLAASANSDRAEMARLDKEFRAIRDGEVSGVLTPMNANIHLQKIAKTYMSRYPHLQKQIKELYQQGYSNIPSSTIEYDPITKAQIDLQARAEKAGKTVGELLRDEELESSSKRATWKATLLAQNGIEYGSAIMDMMNLEGSAALSQIIDTIEKQTASGKFNANMGQQAIAETINGLRASWVQKIAEMEARSRESGSPFILSANDKTQMMNAALQPLNALLDKAGNWDSLERSTKWLANAKALRSHRFDNILDQIIPAPLLAMAGENTDLNAFLTMFGNIQRVMARLNDNRGSIPELLRQSANEADSQLAGTIALAPYLFSPNSPIMKDANLQAWTGLAAAYNAESKGVPAPPPPPPSGDKNRDTATAISYATTARAGLSTGDKTQMRTGLVGMASMSPKILLKEPSTRAILGNPQMKDVALDTLTTLTNRLTAIGSRMKLTDLEKFDPVTGQRKPEEPIAYSVKTEVMPDQITPSPELKEYSDIMNVYREVGMMANMTEDEVNAKIVKAHQGFVQAEQAAVAAEMAKPGFFQRLLGDGGEAEFGEKVKQDTLTGLKNAVSGPDVNPEILQMIQNEIATDGANPKIKTLASGAYEHSETGTIYTVNEDPVTKKWTVTAKKNK